MRLLSHIAVVELLAKQDFGVSNSAEYIMFKILA